jgi:hypothetical protein
MGTFRLIFLSARKSLTYVLRLYFTEKRNTAIFIRKESRYFVNFANTLKSTWENPYRLILKSF